MKNLLKVFILSIVFNSVTWIIPEKANAQVSVSFQVFYDDLSPYGSWVENPDYGYVWFPNVAVGFTPYGTNGHWVFTDAGWTWVSNYPWGWAPFHYGRWYSDPVYGPMWVPDYEWGPGWVTWRRSEGYYGWAPIEPGISISLAYSSGYEVPHERWTFVRSRDFGRSNINSYYVNRSNNVTIINNTTVINNERVDNTRNASYNGGPDRVEVEKRSGKRINPVAIKESNKPGQNLSGGELQLYRPRIEKISGSGQKATPSKVMNLKEVKPPSERNTENRQKKSNPSHQEQPAQQQQRSQPQNQQRMDENGKQQQKEQRRDQPAIDQKQEQRNNQPERQQLKEQRRDQPAIDQKQEQRNNQPERQQQKEQQRQDQPAKQQKPQEQRMDQPNKQERQNNQQPSKQQQNQRQPQQKQKSQKPGEPVNQKHQQDHKTK